MEAAIVIKERINSLRKLMAERELDIYLIPTSDFHESEYVGDFFKARTYMSGFTGSAGTLVVTQEEAGLWADGRYFIQAEQQLQGSGIELYRMGIEGVQTVDEFIVDKIPHGGKLGFDGRVINTLMGSRLERQLKKKEATIYSSEDLVDMVWEGRPELSCQPAFLLDIKYSGKSTADKLIEVRKKMKEEEATALILTTLDDIAWLFNIRGNDIAYNPVVLAYAVIKMDVSILFVNPKALNSSIVEALSKNNVIINNYEGVYEYVWELNRKEVVLLDKKKVNYAIYKSLDSNIEVIDKINPTTLLKAVKNPIELDNLRKSHIKDGVAVTKFMYWLKTNVNKIKITEISASDYLEGLRKEQEGYIELSFDTISAYQEHAAMMHYSATEESDSELKAEGLLLVDSGGQYFEGTTDITRTFVLGPIKDEWKKHYTLVTKSMLNLANAKFLYGCNGINLDILARGPLWNVGIDYRSGTGHGVGYLLNVHEAPNGFRWKHVPERNDSAVFEEGMVTTDEPGVYVEGSHGIRIENELVCRKDEVNEYGQFMSFETITFAPIDLDGIDTKYLDKSDIKQLNDYHTLVYEKISPYLEKEEKQWLKEYTRVIE